MQMQRGMIERQASLLQYLLGNIYLSSSEIAFNL